MSPVAARREGPTTRTAHPEPAVRTSTSPALPRPVVGLALLAALLRLPYVAAPLSHDEAGYLMIARQWHAGPSLYGHYWVDRPPLLLELFRVAGAGGGHTALRLLGCVAAALTVLGVGLAVRRVGSPSASTWSAAAACALLVSPLVGTTPVNGELLAAPFIAFGVWLAVCAIDGSGRGRAGWAAAGAGACATAAVLVKQNMLDVAVFAVVLGLVALRLGWSRAALGRAAIWFTGGGLATAVAVLGLARWSGTSPGGVFFAMYPFRWHATSVVEHHGLHSRIARLLGLGSTELLSVGPVLLVALAVVLVVLHVRHRHPLGDWVPVAVATLALAAYAVVSIAAGGSYWGHYLVQLAVPTSLAAGLLVAAVPRLGRRLVAVVLVVAAVSWGVGLSYRVEARSLEVGADVGRVADPGDTMVSALGDADTLEAAGLSSPYPYLWALPARTLDPGLTRLGTLLSGPAAPTWVVVRGPQTLRLLNPAPGRPLRSHYRLVARICGRAVYLHDGVQRPVPRQLGPCTRSLSGWAAPIGEMNEELAR